MTLKTNSNADVLMENDMEIKNTIVSDGIDDLLPELVLLGNIRGQSFIPLGSRAD